MPQQDAGLQNDWQEEGPVSSPWVRFHPGPLRGFTVMASQLVNFLDSWAAVQSLTYIHAPTPALDGIMRPFPASPIPYEWKGPF